MYGWTPTDHATLAQEYPHFSNLISANHLKLALIERGLEPQVRLLGETKTLFSSAEAQLVEAKQGWLREMYFTDNDTPVTYGRTLVPEHTWQAYQTQFEALGTRPIGEILLHNKSHVVREPFEFGYIDAGSELYQSAVQGYDILAPRLWGRRSRFLMSGYPLVIIEIFLL